MLGSISRPSQAVNHQPRQWKPSGEAHLSSITRASTRAGEVRCEDFLYILKAGPAGGRLRRPSSRRQRHDGHPGAGLTEHSADPAGFMLRCSWHQGMLW
jgi:hypothetical protein